jgi:hypothetical protein
VRHAAGIATAAAALVAAFPAGAEESFDVSGYERKTFEWSGYAELRPEEQLLRRGSAGYLLQFPGQDRRTLERLSAAAELSGVLRYESLSLNATGHATYQYDALDHGGDARLYQAYAAWQGGSRSSVEVGKRSLRWGKGYAWSPVAFFERPKDPTDPELSREGFVIAAGELVQSFGGPLQTLALTALVLPTTAGLNGDFGPSGSLNVAGKLYALLFDTDVDLIFAAPGTQGTRFGADFSRNLGSNLEVHGEWARTTSAQRVVVTGGGALARESRPYTSYLLGLRYLTERELTLIFEYYYNGGGYTGAELRQFFDVVRGSVSNPALSGIAAAAGQGYNRPNAMRNYLYLRLIQPEPFDILYFTPALTAIVNTDDGSFSLIPEVVYTRVNNLELRLRVALNWGEGSTDYGEKPVGARVELRARYFF